MSSTFRNIPLPSVLAASALLFAACQDAPPPTAPSDRTQGPQASRAQAPQEVPFTEAAREVLALPATVFADHDEAAGELVFGVERADVIPGVEQVLARLGLAPADYRVEVVEPIHFMETLRDRHRPTLGGIQIHFGMFLCTLGFNVDHDGGRSFITNSHCTDQQGEDSGTTYFQPTSSVDPDPIATEADDPAYFRGGECPRGRQCRYSDASRALYGSDTDSDRGIIAKTTGVNDGSIEVDGSFTVASQDNSTTEFPIGARMDKVGRTTGWTAGEVSNTCATVNVAGSNITLLCQTLVESDQEIVAGGDSGSPVFTVQSGDDVELAGILWGGSSSGDLFVFSPLKNIQDELGGLTATESGEGGGTGDGGDDEDGGDDDDDGPNCPPNSNAPHCG